MIAISTRPSLEVSVIVPVYNRPFVVRDCIESVMRQSQPCEIIVVDDGSNEAHHRNVIPYTPRVKYIRTKSNKGVSAARNIGVDAALGRYIAFLDSDDLFLKTKIEKQLAFMLDSGCRASHTDEFWFKTDRFINQGKAHTKYGGHILPQILDKCRISPSALMLERDVFLNIGGFDESLRVCEDYELCLRLAAKYEIAYLPEKLMIKRAITDNSLSASIRHIESIRLEILEKFATTEAIPPYAINAVQAELARKRRIVK